MANLLVNNVLVYGHRASQTPFRPNSTTRPRARRAVVRAEQSKQKVVAVLYKAGKAAENKDLLGCVQTQLALSEFLEEQVNLYVRLHAFQCASPHDMHVQMSDELE